MIVDDDPALLELLTDYLGRLGYRVVGVSDGRDAGRVFAEVPPRCEYTLTAKGQDLTPILRQMAVWGSRYYAGAHQD